MVKTIDVSDLPEPLVEEIESMIRVYRSTHLSRTTAETRPPAPIGWLKGKWEVPDSFFDPLPDDLLDLFEGKGPEADEL